MFLVALRKCTLVVLVALWAAPFIHHGSTKRAVPDMTDAVCVAGGEIDGGAGRPALPKGQTNGIPVGRDVPVAPAAATSASVASDAAASSEPATTADGRFRVAVRPATNDLARPDGVALFDRWRRRGAADDAFRLAPTGWWLRLTDGFSDGVTVFSRGEIRPNVRTPCFPPVFADRVSLLPQARWHMLGAGAAESGLWHCLTPSNSLLIGWTNAAPGRDPSAPTNAVAEFFRDGRFTYRHADSTIEYVPVLPFDWDGDGLENAVDPDPRVAGPDAHGTNAEWHRVVCSNVFAAADADTSLQTRVGVGDGLGAGMLLRIQFSPFSVSFSNLEMQEVPADIGNWPQWGSHSGYFDDMAYYGRWCHTTAWGAGTWHGVDELNAMGFDRSRIWTWAKPWSDGRLSWKIPYGWRRKYSGAPVCAGEIRPPSYSVWSMSPDFLEKTKHGHRVGQSVSGEVYFDGVLQYENGQE